MKLPTYVSCYVSAHMHELAFTDNSRALKVKVKSSKNLRDNKGFVLSIPPNKSSEVKPSGNSFLQMYLHIYLFFHCSSKGKSPKTEWRSLWRNNRDEKFDSKKRRTSYKLSSFYTVHYCYGNWCMYIIFCYTLKLLFSVFIYIIPSPLLSLFVTIVFFLLKAYRHTCMYVIGTHTLYQIN